MQRLGLRHILFIGFTLISVVPVIFLGVWVKRTLIDSEFDAVQEKHLLLARNLTGALTRYVTDARTVFHVVSSELAAGNAVGGLRDVLQTLEFRHVCVVDAAGTVERSFVTGSAGTLSGYEPLLFTAGLAAARMAADAQPGKPVFSNVLPDANGRPTLYLVEAIGEGRYALGALATAYIVEVQQAIAFGKRGHAAIVDRTGRVMAHPNPQWRAEMKDLSRVEPVRLMMAGQTGVTTFFSPALKADMVAGFTTVQDVGWGVMIPQPVAELQARAQEVQRAALLFAGIGILTAAVISWWLAGYLAGPLQAVVNTSRAMAAGDRTPRVKLPPRWMPQELRELAQSFDRMVDEVSLRDAELRQTADEAHAANRAKSEFLANMNHELRTPLNAIIGFSEAMRSELLGPLPNANYRDYAADINISAQHLLEMINDSLDLSAVEAGRLAVTIARVDLAKAAADSIRLLRAPAAANDVALDLVIAPGLPMLMSDANRLRQIFLNLLSNAIKFTPAGGSVRLEIDSDAAGDIVIRVIDTGIGIRPEEMDKVMAPFGQVESALARKHHGTGLGLPLTHRLVDMLGGSLSLVSTPGAGTVVTLIFPAAAALAQQACETAEMSGD